jgi:PAS domain-containing protein
MSKSQPQQPNSIKLAYALTALGTILVGLAALAEYIHIITLPSAVITAREAAGRLLVVFMLVLTGFECALLLLHLHAVRQQRKIEDQAGKLAAYSKRLEGLVSQQIGKIQRVMTKFQAIADGVPVILWAVDRDGTVKFAEGSGLRSLGVRSRDVMGRKLGDVVGADSPMVKHVQAALAGKSLSVTDKVADTWFAANYAPVRDDTGTVAGVIMVAVDVLDEFRLARQVSAARAHAQGLASHLTDGVIIYSEDRVIMANAAAAAMLGLDKDDLIGAGVEQIIDRDNLNTIIEWVPVGEEYSGMEFSLYSYDHSPLTGHGSVFIAQSEGHRETMLIIKGVERPKQNGGGRGGRKKTETDNPEGQEAAGT